MLAIPFLHKCDQTYFIGTIKMYAGCQECYTRAGILRVYERDMKKE